MLTLHTEALLRRVEENAAAALEAMGETAVALTREQMRSGYARPILESGALMASIAYQAEDGRVAVGSPLPYASAVHDGSPRVPGRPFLADALLDGADALAQAAAQALRQGL